MADFLAGHVWFPEGNPYLHSAPGPQGPSPPWADFAHWVWCNARSASPMLGSSPWAAWHQADSRDAPSEESVYLPLQNSIFCFAFEMFHKIFQVLCMPHSSSLRRFLRKIRLWCFVFSPFRPAADALPRHPAMAPQRVAKATRGAATLPSSLWTAGALCLVAVGGSAKLMTHRAGEEINSEWKSRELWDRRIQDILDLRMYQLQPWAQTFSSFLCGDYIILYLTSRLISQHQPTKKPVIFELLAPWPAQGFGQSLEAEEVRRLAANLVADGSQIIPCGVQRPPWYPSQQDNW